MTITTKLKIGLIVLLPYLYVFPSAAQTDKDYPWMQYYDQLIELEDIDDENIENTYDILMSLSENKINLNTATKEDLEQIIFLTPQQIEEISEYIYKYGPIRTMGELAMIESLDAVRRQLLSYFVYIDNEQKKQFPTIKNILKYGKMTSLQQQRYLYTSVKATRTDTWAININIGSDTCLNMVSMYK